MKNDMQPLSPDAAKLEPPQEGLRSFPPKETWSDWSEYDAAAWPKRVKRHYDVIPTICFNCEAGCGLLAYVDKETLKIRKFEGNPEHPGSRGRNCAKGPATINQVYDTERILYPMKRVGRRCRKTGVTRSCTTWVDPGMNSSITSVSCTPGALMPTIVTPTSAPLAPERATPAGAELTVPLRITPIRASCCC